MAPAQDPEKKLTLPAKLRLIKWLVQSDPVLPFSTGIVHQCALDHEINQHMPAPGRGENSGNWVIELYRELWRSGARVKATPLDKEFRQIIAGCGLRGRNGKISNPKFPGTLDDGEDAEGDRLRMAGRDEQKKDGSEQKKSREENNIQEQEGREEQAGETVSLATDEEANGSEKHGNELGDTSEKRASEHSGAGEKGHQEFEKRSPKAKKKGKKRGRGSTGTASGDSVKGTMGAESTVTSNTSPSKGKNRRGAKKKQN